MPGIHIPANQGIERLTNHLGSTRATAAFHQQDVSKGETPALPDDLPPLAILGYKVNRIRCDDRRVEVGSNRLGGLALDVGPDVKEDQRPRVDDLVDEAAIGTQWDRRIGIDLGTMTLRDMRSSIDDPKQQLAQAQGRRAIGIWLPVPNRLGMKSAGRLAPACRAHLAPPSSPASAKRPSPDGHRRKSTPPEKLITAPVVCLRSTTSTWASRPAATAPSRAVTVSDS